MFGSCLQTVCREEAHLDFNLEFNYRRFSKLKSIWSRASDDCILLIKSAQQRDNWLQLRSTECPYALCRYWVQTRTSSRYYVSFLSASFNDGCMIRLYSVGHRRASVGHCVEKTEALGGNSVSVQIFPPQIPRSRCPNLDKNSPPTSQKGYHLNRLHRLNDFMGLFNIRDPLIYSLESTYKDCTECV